jgi:threonine/homoserine/homoserine lactone efflux protein
MLSLILSSLVLGITFCALPGVIMAESMRRGFARGFWAVLFLELGSLVGDAVWAFLTLAGAALLVQNIIVRFILGLAGTIYLFFLGWFAFRDAYRGGIPESNNTLNHGDFTAGVLLSLSNPMAIAFWLGAGSTAVTANLPNPQWTHYMIFFLVFMSGAFGWCFFMAGLIAWGRKFITPFFFRYVSIGCGLLLLYFGLKSTWVTFKVLKFLK